MIPYPNNGRWSVWIDYGPIVFREGPYYLDEIGCISFKKIKSRNLFIPPTRLTTFEFRSVDINDSIPCKITNEQIWNLL